MGYHTKYIKKGVLGEISKLIEEYEELNDSGGSNILMLCELSDYYGALIHYIEKYSILDEVEIKYFDLAQDDLDLLQSIQRFNYHHGLLISLDEEGSYIQMPQVIHSIVSDINSISKIFNMDIKDIKQFSKMTSEAFKKGNRGNKSNIAIIDLQLLEHRLDIALSKETKETLNKYIKEKRMSKYNFKPSDVVMCTVTKDIGIVEEVSYGKNGSNFLVEVVWMESGNKTIYNSEKYDEGIPIIRITTNSGEACRSVGARKDGTKPDHYSDNDPFKIMEDNCTFEEIMGAVKLNIIKYALRTKGQDKEDLEKIIAYANWGLKQYK